MYWSSRMRIGIKMRLLILLLFLIGCGEEPLKTQVFEITCEVTGEVYLLRKEPKLKKSIVYCTKRKENVVVWVDWHPNQTPEYTYKVDSYKNYLEKNWVEQHYGYRIAP